MQEYPVLVPLSACYSRHKDRLSTRYSPVRHSTRNRSPVRVRLACVKHAASVRSEPGSNSPVYILANHNSIGLFTLQFKPILLGPLFYCSVFKDQFSRALGSLSYSSYFSSSCCFCQSKNQLADLFFFSFSAEGSRRRNGIIPCLKRHVNKKYAF